ncbi:hypothetical protein, conserved [Eimeria praecox]|uniref:Uncharacterized protein n=1 Tax=Eimeria praecox TaxID=51316 RepID=U6GFS0_9EIME|nr:hypothetical protein, conserved [Eimeria praecox]
MKEMQHMDTAATTVTDSSAAAAAAAAVCRTPTEAAAADAAAAGCNSSSSNIFSPTSPLFEKHNTEETPAQNGTTARGRKVDREKLASAAMSRLQSLGPSNAAAAAAAAAPAAPAAAAAGAAAAAAGSSIGPPHLHQWLSVVCKLKTVVAVGEGDDDPLLLQFLRYLQNGGIQYTEAVVLAGGVDSLIPRYSLLMTDSDILLPGPTEIIAPNTKLMKDIPAKDFALFTSDCRVAFGNPHALKHFNIQVFDTTGEVFSPGVAASFLVLCGFGVVQAMAHVKRKADYCKERPRLDSTVVTELYRLAGGLRPPTDSGPLIAEPSGQILVSTPENPVDEIPNTEALVCLGFRV